MEVFDLVLWPPTVWHWLALGLILISIEMAVGTFDLLWISIAAGLTSAFTAFAPDSLTSWQGQIVFFFVTAVIMFVIGRTVFRKIRDGVPEHPTLNKRMASTIGARGTVATGFSGGIGRVKLGDTVWSAQTADGSDLPSGAPILVEGTEGNMLIVKAT